MLYLEIQEGKERMARQKYVGAYDLTLTLPQSLNLTLSLPLIRSLTLTLTRTLTFVPRRVPGNISLHSAHAGRA
jgi:hypothetical protein